MLQPPGKTTVHLTLMEDATVKALYRLGNIKPATTLADGESDSDTREAGSQTQPASGASAGGAGACGALSGMGLIALPLCLMGWMVKRGRAGRRS